MSTIALARKPTCNEPSFSPKGDLAVELVYGEDSAYYEDRPVVNILRRTGAKFIRVWSAQIVKDYTYRTVDWTSNESVDIEEVTQPSSKEEGSTRVFSLVRRGRGWR